MSSTFSMKPLLAFASLAALKSVLAQSCWRDTVCTGLAVAAFPGPWERYNYSPMSRTIRPAGILPTASASTSVPFIPGTTTAQLKGNGSRLIFDFEKEVGGIVSVSYTANGSGSLGLAFTEAKNWTGEWSDSSNGSFNPDGALYANITQSGAANYTMPDSKMRGGFRYFTVFSLTESDDALEIDIGDINLELSFQPTWSNLQAYHGYFYSNDDLINRIWWAGAYTLQTNAIPPSSGRAFPILDAGWSNDEMLNLGTNGSTVYVDGSKRDRTIWTGDLVISIPSILVSTGDSDGVKNSLQTIYNDQLSTGELPFAGPAINNYGSDTYHMSTMIGTYEYYLYTGDESFLNGIWHKYLLATSFITAKLDSTGLLYVTGTNDWGRLSQGGHNTEANMLMYRTLVTGVALARWIGDSDSASNLTSFAAKLKSAINSPRLWDASAGAFKDNDTDTGTYVHPEDGNSMALYFDAADPSYVQSISEQLTHNWGPIGAVCPELPENLVGFVQSFEIKGHLMARQPTRALDLMSLAWGWYLDNPYGTNSTCIEGYLSDGTFGYRATDGYDNDYSYTSHAHGWGTGPTDALTSYVVGLQITSPGGSNWTLAPQFGSLTYAEAGFTTMLGSFSAYWTLIDGGYDLWWSCPMTTSGSLVLPVPITQSASPSLQVDGDPTAISSSYNQSAGLIAVAVPGGYHVGRLFYN